MRSLSMTEALADEMAWRDAMSRVECADPEVRYWITRDGRAMLVSEMDDQHLLNAIAFLERNEESYRLNTLMRYYVDIPEWMLPRGQGAQDAFDREVEMLADAEMDEVFPPYRWLREEAHVRELMRYVAPEDR